MPLALLSTLCLAVGAAPQLVTVWDGYDAFTLATADHVMEAALRSNGRAGGVNHRAVFLHPKDGDPARLTYPVTLPKLGPEDRLVFTTLAGLADGVKPEEHPMDGVGLGLEIGGELLGRVRVDEPGWEPLAIDLAPLAGQTIELVLRTDDGGGAGNVSYDWAMFGEPRIMLLRGSVLKPDLTSSALSGGLLAKLPEHGIATALHVRPIDAQGKPVGEGLTAVLGTARLVYLDFDLSRVDGARGILVEPDGVTPTELRVSPYLPALTVENLGTRDGVVFAGRPFEVQCVLRNTGRAPFDADHKLEVSFGGALTAIRPVERLLPGDTVTLTAQAPAAAAGEVQLGLGATWQPEPGRPDTLDEMATVRIYPPLPKLPSERAAARELKFIDGVVLLQNEFARVVVGGQGAGPVVWYTHDGQQYREVARSPYLAEVCLEAEPAAAGEVAAGEYTAGFAVTQPIENGKATLTTRCLLRPKEPVFEVITELTANQPIGVRALRGPAVLVSDGTGKTTKRVALFPGLEYLKDDEPSSSTRDFDPPLNVRTVPDPYKVTMPMMAIERDDAVVAVLWDQEQTWSAQRSMLSATFGSPNLLDGQANHLLQLFCPSGTDLVPENTRLAAEPFEVPAGGKLSFSQEILLQAKGTVLDAVDEWYRLHHGVPQPQAKPRDLAAELALCSYGFSHTVWDPETNKSKHCVGWAGANAPQFGALLLTSAQLQPEPTEAAAARAQAELILSTTLTEQGERGLASNANCHIMRWNLPFLYGHLDGACAALKSDAYAAIGGQDPDGGWRFHPDEKHAMLGEDGAVELGTCANPMASIWRWARLTGDPVAIEAGLKALEFADRFVVPAGAQGWECPIHGPDILASAWAIRAYLDAYRVTGRQHFLDQAIYWARTGLPFCYQWDDPALPGMRWATIPVFNSTHRSHSWLGVPVQWCGLVYAYAIQQLAPYEPQRPWRQIADGITTSAMYQQFGDEMPQYKGCYPDGWYQRFTRRSGPIINPEDILLNYLALHDADPEIQTAIIKVGGQPVHVSSGARVQDATVDGTKVAFKLASRADTTTCTMLPFIAAPSGITLNGRAAKLGDDLDAEGIDARYDPQTVTLFLRVKHGAEPSEVTVSGVKRAEPPSAPERTAWTFDTDTDGWRADHGCRLTLKAGALVCEVTGDDPYCSAPNASFQAKEYGRLVVRARSTTVNLLGLFWGSVEHPGTSPQRHTQASLTADGQWHEVTFDLAQEPAWQGRINLLRLDPEPASLPAGTTLEIDTVTARR